MTLRLLETTLKLLYYPKLIRVHTMFRMFYQPIKTDLFTQFNIHNNHFSKFVMFMEF